MKNRYSIQQLNQNLPEVLEQIQQGNLIEITQAGKPFAFILSTSEYQRLTAIKSNFWESLQSFRTSHNLAELEIAADVFDDVRDRSSGREVNF